VRREQGGKLTESKLHIYSDLNESKVFGLDSQQELGPQDLFRTVKRDVKSRDTSVGGW